MNLVLPVKTFQLSVSSSFEIVVNTNNVGTGHALEL